MPDNRPILIGVAQQTWRDKSPERTLIDALCAVSTAAIEDAGGAQLLKSIDAVASVPFLAGLVPGLTELMPPNPGSAVCERLGIEAQTYTTQVGGNTPQQLVNHFADRLVAGEAQCVLICGGELIATLSEGLKTGADLGRWSRGGAREAVLLGKSRPPCTELEKAHGMFEPVNTYPLFESALRHARGWNRDQHLAHLGGMISRMSEVAAANPHAWRRDTWTPEAAISTDNRNRMITYPYTRVMNAILGVDMAAAAIMTTADRARAMGVDPAHWVYLRGSADATDIWNVSERPVLHESPAIHAAAAAALEQAGLAVADLDLFDIYSCFPSAVQVACDAIGLAADDPRGVTLTGGLTMFGGPGNNYSLHGIAEMVSQLRRGAGRHGMVTANGNYLTKHAVGVYSTVPGEGAWPAAGRPDLQRELDQVATVPVAAKPQGQGVLEAHAVAFADGKPARGILLGRLDDGQRFIANTAAEDTALLTRLHRDDLVGQRGQVTPGDPVNLFRLDS